MNPICPRIDRVCGSSASGARITHVLADIRLTIDQGEFVPIIGHSGCGKSTLPSPSAGLMQATTGGSILGGREVNAPGPDRAGVPEPQPAALADRLPEPEREAGGGQVFGALDALACAHLQHAVMEIRARLGKTVIAITRDVDEAVLLAARVVRMTNGPAATIGEVLTVPIFRPPDRIRPAGHPDHLGAREAVLPEDGTVCPADPVCMAAGIRPEVRLANGSGREDIVFRDRGRGI